MRRVSRLSGTASVVCAALLTSGAAALGDPPEATIVNELTATVQAEAIAVTGQATFVDMPVQVAADDAADSLGGEAPLGDDVTTATISRPDPFVDALKFTVGVANQPPTLFGIPEFIVYRWRVSVDSVSGSPVIFQLIAQRSAQWARPGSLEPYFALFTCASGPVGQCNPATSVDGAIGDGVVEWNVPLEDIGGQVGSVISGAGPAIDVLASLSSAAWGGPALDQADTETNYTVPGSTVRVGLAPAGTPPEQVSLTVDGAVEPDGTFFASLPRPLDPGTYTVVAQACQGPASCGLASTDITL